MPTSLSTLADIFRLAAYPSQTIGALGMFSVIWAVQLIIYPSFREIDAEKWPEFHQRHCQRMGYIVGPLMCFELLGGIAFVLTKAINTFSIALLTTSILTWLTTAIIFLPLHRHLGKRHDPATIQKLIKLNWMRTILWSAAAIVWTVRHMVDHTAA